MNNDEKRAMGPKNVTKDSSDLTSSASSASKRDVGSRLESLWKWGERGILMLGYLGIQSASFIVPYLRPFGFMLAGAAVALVVAGLWFRFYRPRRVLGWLKLEATKGGPEGPPTECPFSLASYLEPDGPELKRIVTVRWDLVDGRPARLRLICGRCGERLDPTDRIARLNHRPVVELICPRCSDSFIVHGTTAGMMLSAKQAALRCLFRAGFLAESPTE